MPVAHGLLHARPCLPGRPFRCTCSIQQPAPAIRVSDVSLAFAGSPGTGQTRKQVLAGINLDVPPGSFHMLLGPNGCGKSTMLKILGGLLKPDTGSCETDTPVGFVFQNPDHQVVMPTVLADVAFGLGRYNLPKELALAQALHALQLVGMQGFGQRPTHTLSGGQKQRVAIAGALAEDPQVLLLDELTTFLDDEDQGGVLRAVRDVTSGDRRVTALWVMKILLGQCAPGQRGGPLAAVPKVTHRLEELRMADSASYMADGRIQFSGPATDVLKYMQKMGAHVD